MTDQMEETEKSQFRKLQSVTSSAVSPSVQSRPATCPPDVASRRAAILLACFRKGEAENPEIYASAVAAVLSSYPEPVAYRVTDPRSGLAGTSKWLPTVAEVRSACEAEMAPARAQEASRLRRERTDAVLAAPPLKRIAKARFEELSAKLESIEDDSKPKPFTLKLVEGQDAFAGKPLASFRII